MKLTDLINEQVLFEGRLEDMKEKYPESAHRLIDMLSDGDPSGNNKYLEWMVKMALGEDGSDTIATADSIISIVKEFHVAGDRLKKHGKKTDINQYKSVEELRNTLENEIPRRETPSKSKLKSIGAELIYDDNDGYMTFITNYKASCEIGGSAAWCIRLPDTSRHWDSYSEDAFFYFWVSKKLPNGDKDMKYALQIRKDNRRITYWDYNDISSSQQPSVIPDAAMEKVYKHLDVAERKMLGLIYKQLKSNPEDVSSGKAIQVMDYLLKDNKADDVKSILSAMPDEWGRDGKFVKWILSEVIKQSVLTDNDFTTTFNMDNLGGLIDKQNFIDAIDGIISIERKRELANKYDKMPKMTRMKWAMTDADWDEYDNNSFYVFNARKVPVEVGTDDDGDPIYKKAPEFESLIAIDRFKESDHHAVAMMKMRARMQGDLESYGIKTEKGLLDDYLGSSINDAPSAFIKSIMQKATKL